MYHIPFFPGNHLMRTSGQILLLNKKLTKWTIDWWTRTRLIIIVFISHESRRPPPSPGKKNQMSPASNHQNCPLVRPRTRHRTSNSNHSMTSSGWRSDLGKSEAWCHCLCMMMPWMYIFFCNMYLDIYIYVLIFCYNTLQRTVQNQRPVISL